jgi:hypothetical protein
MAGLEKYLLNYKGCHTPKAFLLQGYAIIDVLFALILAA